MNCSSKDEVLLSARSGANIQAHSSVTTQAASNSRMGGHRLCKSYAEKMICLFTSLISHFPFISMAFIGSNFFFYLAGELEKMMSLDEVVDADEVSHLRRGMFELKVVKQDSNRHIVV